MKHYNVVVSYVIGNQAQDECIQVADVSAREAAESACVFVRAKYPYNGAVIAKQVTPALVSVPGVLPTDPWTMVAEVA